MISTASLEELASYVPALILRRMTADLGATLAPSVERFPAAVLIADLSGFTALTEHLAQHSPAGAEELTRILDLYFGQLVGVVMSHGGDVVKFAGDGLLALWYGPAPLRELTQRAVQCGLAVQMMTVPEAWGSLEDAGAPPALKVRVGVGAGDVTIMHLGGIFGRWELLVTGEALTQTGRAEAEARSGEVVVAAEAWPLIAEACIGQSLPSGAVRLLSLVDYLPMSALAQPALIPAMADTLRAYIPKAILARLDAGQTNWLAEQRRVSVLFVNLPDLRADTPLQRAQAMMRALQTSLYRYEGSITRLGTDAKGPALVAALGLPPLAHEDDPERGVRAALMMRQSLAELGFRVAIGVTTGRALCGAVGGLTRREYTMMGPMVNRSARLMQAAAAAAAPILCDEATYRAARSRLAFEPLPPLSLKGVAAPVAVFTPAAKAATPAEQPAHAEALFGRQREQSQIAQRVADLARGLGGPLIIEGEAGIGKSSLLAYTRAVAGEAGITVLTGAGSPVELSPYHAWRSVFAELIPLLSASGRVQAAEGKAQALGARATGDAERDGADGQLAQMAFDAIDELDMPSLAPLLGAVLPLSLPDSARTALMVGQVRADNTRDLLVRLVERAAAHGPLLLAFEDAQWLDASSWALLLAVAERVGRLLIAVAARPLAETPPAFQRLAYMPGSLRLLLRGLDPEAMRDLLARRLGVESVPEPLWQLIATRSQGNPFVGEELLHALQESGTFSVSDGTCRLAPGALAQLASASNLPDTVEGLITSRIDRLTATQQLTLKVASVIGPVFTLGTLAVIHPVELEPERLVEQLFALQQAGLVLIESFEPELTYAFKHALGCEVAYNLMSFGQRRRLHRQLAEAYEAAGPPLRVSAAQMAHHWRQAEEPARAMVYLAQAGEEALRGGAYGEAAGFLDEALVIAAAASSPSSHHAPVDSLTMARWERQLGEAYHGLGRLIESRELLEQAVARLGFPVCERQGQELIALSGELLRQTIALVLPPRLRVRDKGEALGEAARAYALLAQLAYYDGQLLPSTYAAVRGLNLAERAGLSPSLAGAYGATQIVAGAVPPLASIYRRRAQAVAAHLDHLPTHGWLAEAQALHDVGHARWRRARGALTIGLAVADHLGDQRRRAECVATRCLVDANQGLFQAALAGCEELQVIGLRSGDVQVRAWGLIGAAENLLCLGADGRAEALLGEAEALLTENFGGARAEEIWLYGLLGRAALRRQAYELSRALASAAAGLLGRVPPATIYALGGYAAVAEAYLGLWEARHAHEPTERRAIAEVSRRACQSLNRFALVFPLARPAALTWQGLRSWLRGRPREAGQLWAAAANVAQAQGMPYDEARALYLRGRHTPGAEGCRLLERAAAGFERLGCDYDLAQVNSLLR
jgi:class 3 adenylate cyclase